MNHMPDYKAMYFALAAQVADAVELLTAAQRAGEETYYRCARRTIRQANRVTDVSSRHIISAYDQIFPLQKEDK
jgi:hypothetical protein